MNLSGSAALIERVEEMLGDVGMTICCAAATVAVEAAFARLFWKLLKWVRGVGSADEGVGAAAVGFQAMITEMAHFHPHRTGKA